MTMLNIGHFLAARATMGRRLAERRAERFGLKIHGATLDAPDMAMEIHDPPAPPIAFHLVYQDSRGSLSGRNFTLRTLQDEINEIRVAGMCHMRLAPRTFLASRMVEVTDLATGEVSEDGLEYFRNHPMLKGLTADHLSTMSAGLIAVQDCRDELIILSFLAASDEDFSSEEEDCIVMHVLDRACDPDVTESDVRQRIRSFVPDELAFERALRRLCTGDGDVRALLRSMRKVVDADGEIDPEEIAFADEVTRRLGEAGRL